MNINSVNNSLNFKGVYTYVNDMEKETRRAAKQLAREIEYTDEISRLDDMGVDVVIFLDRNSEDEKHIDKAKVVFVALKNERDTLYKPYNGMDYIEIKNSEEDLYSENKFNKVIDVARKILSGEIFKTTGSEVKSIKQMHNAGFYKAPADTFGDGHIDNYGECYEKRVPYTTKELVKILKSLADE